MAFRRTEGVSMIQALAMTVAEIPVFLYTTFGQVTVGWRVDFLSPESFSLLHPTLPPT